MAIGGTDSPNSGLSIDYVYFISIMEKFLMKEQVLVCPAKLLKKLEFKDCLIKDQVLTEKTLSFLLKQSFFMERDKAEDNSEFKQFVGYANLYQNSKIFTYKRTKKSGEKRLHDLWSIGVGGHVSTTDAKVLANPDEETFWNSVERELKEEVGLEHDFTYKCQGLINDNSTKVGEVHLGIIIKVNLGKQSELSFKDQSLSNHGFETIDTLKKNIELFENWSKLIIQNLN